MPTKKKKKNKNKKRGQRRDRAARATPQISVAEEEAQYRLTDIAEFIKGEGRREGTTNEGWEAMDLANYLKLTSNPDKINAKRLAKYAPNLVQLIEQEGFNAFKDKTWAWMDSRFKENPELAYFTRKGRLVRSSEITFLSISQLIAPGVGLQAETLQVQCSSYIQSKLSELPKLGMKEVSNLALQRFKPDIIKTCHDGDQDSFERYWESYRPMTSEEYSDAAISSFLKGAGQGIKRFYDKICAASLNIELGVHKSTRICWACGQTAKDFKECGSCVAKYCNQQCQVDHWKNGGHKFSCDETKILWGLLKDAEDIITLAFQNRELHQQNTGLEPCPKLEFAIASTIIHGHIISEGCSDWSGAKPAGPRMSNFYANIKHIMLEGRHNGWWKDLPPTGLPRTLVEFADVYSAFQNEFLAACHALLFDYTAINEDEKEIWFLFKMQNSGFFTAESCQNIFLMPPEAWVCHYLNILMRWETSINVYADVQEYKRLFQLQFFEQFRSTETTEKLVCIRHLPVMNVQQQLNVLSLLLPPSAEGSRSSIRQESEVFFTEIWSVFDGWRVEMSEI